MSRYLLRAQVSMSGLRQGKRVPLWLAELSDVSGQKRREHALLAGKELPVQHFQSSQFERSADTCQPRFRTGDAAGTRQCMRIRGGRAITPAAEAQRGSFGAQAPEIAWVIGNRRAPR